jgi:hypothetical protein
MLRILLNKMKYLIILILMTGCVGKDYDFNPTTTILKQLIKGKNDSIK